MSDANGNGAISPLTDRAGSGNLPRHLDYVRLIDAAAPLGAHALAVAMLLARYRSHDRSQYFGLAWPSAGMIAKTLGTARSTVCERLALLTEKGIIQKAGEHPATGTVMYRFLVGNQADIGTTPVRLADIGNPPDVRQADRGCPPGGQGVSARRTQKGERKRRKETCSPTHTFSASKEGNTAPAEAGAANGSAHPASVEVAIPEAIDTPEFHAVWELWLKHLQQRGAKRSQPSLQADLANLARLGPKGAVDQVDYCTRMNWLTIHPEREQSGKANGKPRVMTDEEKAAYYAKGRYNG